MPTTGQVGNHSVVFAVSDGHLSASETVVISVVAPTTTSNTAPVLDPVDILAGVAGAPLSYQFTASDAENDPLQFSGSSLPSGVTLAASGAFAWTPVTPGGYIFTATVSDGKLTHSRLIPALVVHPSYDWLFGAKLQAQKVINETIFVFAYRRQGNSAVVFVWTKPGVTASAAPVPDMSRTSLTNQPVTSNALSPAPLLYHAGKRVSPRQALDAVLAAISY
jgi:hypothetical protein